MERHALGKLGGKEVQNPIDEPHIGRIEVLISIGVSFGVNCSSSFKNFRDNAGSYGVTEGELEEVVRLALLIKGKAAHHVERLCKFLEEVAA